MVELDFFQIFLPYSFRLIGPQTKQGCMHPCSAEIGLNLALATSDATLIMALIIKSHKSLRDHLRL